MLENLREIRERLAGAACQAELRSSQFCAIVRGRGTGGSVRESRPILVGRDCQHHYHTNNNNNMYWLCKETYLRASAVHMSTYDLGVALASRGGPATQRRAPSNTMFSHARGQRQNNGALKFREV
jgi:hypothetical protein